MGNFALQISPCNFLILCLNPREVLIPFLLCFSSLSALSLPWRILSSFSTKQRSFPCLPPFAVLGRHGAEAAALGGARWRGAQAATGAGGSRRAAAARRSGAGASRAGGPRGGARRRQARAEASGAQAQASPRQAARRWARVARSAERLRHV
jgi:hypothetical protein